MAQGPIHNHSCGHEHPGTPLSAPSGGGHRHAPSMPHPAQTVPRSLLRMGLAARLGSSLLIVAGLWLVILAAVRPL